MVCKGKGGKETHHIGQLKLGYIRVYSGRYRVQELPTERWHTGGCCVETEGALDVCKKAGLQRLQNTFSLEPEEYSWQLYKILKEK